MYTAAGVRADDWNKKTILTFSGPVQIPGATLAGGSYVCWADSAAPACPVQVFDKDREEDHRDALGHPKAMRLDANDEPVLMFSERPAGSPQAVKVWFYPGNRIGNEFVYPKSMAMKIAKANHQSVLAMDDSSTSSAFKTAQVGRFDEEGVWKAEGDTAVVASTTPAPEATAAPTSTTMAQATAKPATVADNNTTGTSGRRATRRSLPRTASPLPLYELLSGLSIAGGLVVRRLRKAA